MKTIQKVTVIPIYVDTMPDYKTFKESHIYISEKYGTTIHRCLCGCGEKIVLPINNIIHKKNLGWNLFKNKNGTISITPSVGSQNLPCKSHYVISNNVANFI